MTPEAIPDRTRRHAGRSLAPFLATTATALALALLAAAHPAAAMVGEGSDEGIEPVLSRTYTVVPRDRLPATLKADRDYVTGMRAHHAGALTMSDEYLRDPAASSPALRDLAVAIMHNQRFEIALLDGVAASLDQPAAVLDLGFARLAVQPAAVENLAIQYRYSKAPIPGPLSPLDRPGAPVSARDVQFARAMTIHHQGALDMARAYQADPNGRNTFLGLLNVDILTDQIQEIGLMRRVVAAFPGDASAIPVPASMIHGMEGMSHGGHEGHAAPAAPANGRPDDRHEGPHAGHGAARPAAVPATPAPPGPRRRAAPTAHHGH